MSKSIVKFIAIIVVIAALMYTGIYGLAAIGLPQVKGIASEDGIRQGLDLKGGSVIVFEAQADNPSNDDMDTAVNTIRKRVDFQGYTEATVTRQGEKSIRVELPDVQDTDQAVATLGSTAQLLFVDSNYLTPKVDENGAQMTSEDGKYLAVDVDEKGIIMTGDQIKDATAEYGSDSGSNAQLSSKASHKVALKLAKEGQEKFSAATAKLVGQTISIVMDGYVISSPRVNQAINSDSCEITGEFTAEEAKSLASNIKSGKIPFSLTRTESRTVSATLGDDALKKAVTAGIIGLALVMLFMLLVYRLMGLMADIALAAYLSIVMLILANFHINLTLPGIAGIILSIGMAVDANVVIFERIKEELTLGKTVRSAVDAGFNRALSAVIDSNVTTIISAVILWVLGTGTIKGFGITLFIGIVVSMVSAIFVTKFLLKQMVGMNLKALWLYGVSPKKDVAEMKGGKA